MTEKSTPKSKRLVIPNIRRIRVREDNNFYDFKPYQDAGVEIKAREAVRHEIKEIPPKPTGRNSLLYLSQGKVRGMVSRQKLETIGDLLPLGDSWDELFLEEIPEETMTELRKSYTRVKQYTFEPNATFPLKTIHLLNPTLVETLPLHIEKQFPTPLLYFRRYKAKLMTIIFNKIITLYNNNEIRELITTKRYKYLERDELTRLLVSIMLQELLVYPTDEHILINQALRMMYESISMTVIDHHDTMTRAYIVFSNFIKDLSDYVSENRDYDNRRAEYLQSELYRKNLVLRAQLKDQKPIKYRTYIRYCRLAVDRMSREYLSNACKFHEKLINLYFKKPEVFAQLVAIKYAVFTIAQDEKQTTRLYKFIRKVCALNHKTYTGDRDSIIAFPTTQAFWNHCMTYTKKIYPVTETT